MTIFSCILSRICVTQYLKEIRHDFKDSRFFFGKNRVMAKALGTTVEEEYKEGLSAIAKVTYCFFFCGEKIRVI